MSVYMLYITFPDRTCAQQMGKELLNKKWVACYNLLPMESAYWWEGSICTENEIIGIFKTTRQAAPLIETYITENHPYDTACVIRWEVQANPAYAEWVKSSVTLNDLG